MEEILAFNDKNGIVENGIVENNGIEEEEKNENNSNSQQWSYILTLNQIYTGSSHQIYNYS